LDFLKDSAIWEKKEPTDDAGIDVYSQ